MVASAEAQPVKSPIKRISRWSDRTLGCLRFCALPQAALLSATASTVQLQDCGHRRLQFPNGLPSARLPSRQRGSDPERKRSISARAAPLAIHVRFFVSCDAPDSSASRRSSPSPSGTNAKRDSPQQAPNVLGTSQEGHRIKAVASQSRRPAFQDAVPFAAPSPSRRRREEGS